MALNQKIQLIAATLSAALNIKAMAETPMIEITFPSLEIKSPKNKPWYNRFNKKGKP